MIYLDNSATSNNKPKKVLDAIINATKNSVNVGRNSSKKSFFYADKLYQTRELLCKLLNVDTPENIIFTNNASMSLNIAIKGILCDNCHIIATKIEHNSVLRQLYSNSKLNFSLLDCDEFGFVKFDNLSSLISENTKLIVVNVASNVTGAIQDYKSIDRGDIPILFDFSQCAGCIPLDLGNMKHTMAAFSGHKSLLGPQGTGVLYFSPDIQLKTILEGGTGSMSEMLIQPDFSPDRFEVGTQNTPAILGLYEGVSFILNSGILNLFSHKIELARHLFSELSNIPYIKIYHSGDFSRHIPVISFNVGNAHSEEVATILSRDFDISLRGGLHCAPLIHQVLKTSDQGAVRASMGYKTKKSEIDKLISAINKIRKM
jgi:cysteine desulfurase family protein